METMLDGLIQPVAMADVGEVLLDRESSDCSHAIVAVLDVDDFVVSRLARGEKWAAVEMRKVEAIAQAERVDAQVSIHKLEPDTWIFILGGDEPSLLGRRMFEFADRLRVRVERATECTVTISLGNVCSGPDQVEQSLSQAVQANQRLTLRGNRVVSTGAAGGGPDALPTPKRIEHTLSQRLLEGDQDGALRVLKGWMTQSVELEHVTPEVLRSSLATVILSALDVVGERRLRDGSIDWFEIFGRSYLRLRLEPLFEQIFDHTAEPPTSGRHIRKLAEAYIQEHYAEDLSLTRVAQAVHASPFYISHLFHRELGTTFLKYLTAIRIAKARQLLLGTSLQVSEIGALVGYGTPKNFRCAFKRAVGVTPSVFRAHAGSV